MDIQQSFVVEYPLATVWASLKNVKLVAECMPGATLTETIADNRFSGRFTVKLGPIVANFEGDVDVATDEGAHAGSIKARATDRRTGTRVQTTMRYAANAEGEGTRVDITGEYSLAGSLAQFARKSFMQDISNRLTASFVDALRGHLAHAQLARVPVSDEPAAKAQSSPSTAKSIDVGRLFWSVLRRWLAGLWKRAVGPKA